MIPRVEAIEAILAHVAEEDVVLTTTGMVSREAFAANDRRGNFYMLGSMGLLPSFGLGLALLAPGRRVYVLDGDGSVLMSLGTLPLIATEAPPDLVHIVLDNEAYESTGGQPSISAEVSLSEIARASGYHTVAQARTDAEIQYALSGFRDTPGPHFLLVKVAIAPVAGIPRVSHTPEEIRDRLRAHLAGEKALES